MTFLGYFIISEKLAILFFQGKLYGDSFTEENNVIHFNTLLITY